VIISHDECRQALRRPVVDPVKVDDAVLRLVEGDVIREITAKVNEMPDREDRVRELKAQVDGGTYQRSGEEIAVAMGRRALADRIR